MMILAQTGIAEKIELFVGQMARNESVSQALLGLVLPSAGEAEPLPSEPDGEAAAEPPSLPAVADEQALHGEGAFAVESMLPFLGEKPLSGGEEVASVSIAEGRQGSGTIYINNDTKYEIDIDQTLGRNVSIDLSGDGPQVLIVHTHATEAYTPDSKHKYIATDTDRTTDNSCNMVQVGDRMAEIFEQNGIEVVHSTVQHDYPAYSGSYDRALKTIKAMVDKYPSIKVIIDVHRDAIISAEGTKYKAVADINGRSAAQLMFVCGTDSGGLTHDHWRDNLSFQMKVHDALNTKYPGIMRPIHVRTGRFNQHVRTGSMLLEVGTTGNSMDEALYSAELFTQTLSDILNGK